MKKLKLIRPCIQFEFIVEPFVDVVYLLTRFVKCNLKGFLINGFIWAFKPI